MRKKAIVNDKYCVACGACISQCPKDAISVYKGMYATVNNELCIGCGICAKRCPTSTIEMKEVNNG